MGKGSRNRSQRKTPVENSTLTKAVRRERIMRVLIIFAACFAVLTALIQWWSLATIVGNLETGVYTDDETASLTRLLPLGYGGIALLLLGTLLAVVCFLRRRQKAALLGTAATVGAGVLFVLYALGLYEVFAYNELQARGLTLLDLLLRHFTPLLVPLLLLIAAIVSHAAAKARALYQMMQEMQDDTPTVALS